MDMIYSRETDLIRMLECLLSQNPGTRFRLSSIEPNEISDDLLHLFNRHPNLCPHLHIPLQSGDDSILKLMKRNYDTAFYRNLIEKVVQAINDIAIGIDVMVGFPGEGEKEFRQHTAAAGRFARGLSACFPLFRKAGNSSPGHSAQGSRKKSKKERAAILRELGVKKRETFSRRFLGKTLPVLVEQSPG